MVGELGRSYLRARRQRHAERAALVQQRSHRHRPAFAGLAKDLRFRHLDILEEDFVELRVAGDLHQRPYLDAWALHVDEQVRQAVARVGLLALARDQHAPLGDVRQRRPDFLAVDHVVVALVLGAGLQTRQVAAGVGLAEALAPDLLRREQRRQVALLLVFGPVRDHHRTAHAQPDHVDGLRRLRQDHLVVEDELLHEARSTTAVLLGPRDADVAGVEELLLPRAAALDEILLALGYGTVTTRFVGLQPGADLVAKFLFRLAQLEVHSPTLSHRGNDVRRQ